MLTHRHIEVFRALMVTGSTTRAAEMLYTSQPTISRELARMEQVVGFALFERAHGRLRPTMAALTLFDDVRLAYVGLERVAATAARLREFRDGQLSVIALPAFSHAILPGACRRFSEQHAGVSVSVATQESPVLEEWLTAQRYDLGLTERDVAPAGTVLMPLLEVDEVCVLPDGHPLLVQDAIDLPDLADRPFVSLSLNDPYRILIDEAFAQLGVAPRSVVETPSAVSVCAFVRQGRCRDRQSADRARFRRARPARAAAHALVSVPGQRDRARAPAEELARRCVCRRVARRGEGDSPPVGRAPRLTRPYDRCFAAIVVSFRNPS